MIDGLLILSTIIMVFLYIFVPNRPTRRAADALWLKASDIAERLHDQSCEIFDGDYPCNCPAGQIGFAMRRQIEGSDESLRMPPYQTDMLRRGAEWYAPPDDDEEPF